MRFSPFIVDRLKVESASFGEPPCKEGLVRTTYTSYIRSSDITKKHPDSGSTTVENFFLRNYLTFNTFEKYVLGSFPICNRTFFRWLKRGPSQVTARKYLIYNGLLVGFDSRQLH
jgi:hypothetical protein